VKALSTLSTQVEGSRSTNNQRNTVVSKTSFNNIQKLGSTEGKEHVEVLTERCWTASLPESDVECALMLRSLTTRRTVDGPAIAWKAQSCEHDCFPNSHCIQYISMYCTHDSLYILASDQMLDNNVCDPRVVEWLSDSIDSIGKFVCIECVCMGTAGNARAVRTDGTSY
jgi:hypothetical protein